MNHCGQCKHWGNSKDVKETFRQCMAVVHDADCDVDSDKDNDPWDETEIATARKQFRSVHKAVVQDGSGWQAALRCREDFGCILFDPQPATLMDDGLGNQS